MGSRVSLPTSRTSFSVISANASAADRCRSTLSLKESVERDRKGSPVKKLVSERSVTWMATEPSVFETSCGHVSRSCSQLPTLKILKEVSDGVALSVEQQRFVLSIPGAAATSTADDSHRVLRALKLLAPFYL